MIKNKIQQNKDIVKGFKFIGSVSKELYYSDDTSYGIYIVRVEKNLNTNLCINAATITVCGSTAQLIPNSKHTIICDRIYSNKYKNYQYQIVEIQSPPINSIQEQQNFIKSILTKSQANILFEIYPDIVNRVVDGSSFTPDFSLLKGIKEKTWNLISQKIRENARIGKLLSIFTPYGITHNQCEKILSLDKNKNVDNVIRLVYQNPYILTNVKGIGFKTADEIAIKLIPNLKVSESRVQAFIQYYLNEIAQSNGSTYITIDELRIAVSNNLDSDKELQQYLDKIINTQKDLTIEQSYLYINLDNNIIGLNKFLLCEKSILTNLRKLNNYNNSVNIIQKSVYKTNGQENIKELVDLGENDISDWINETEKELGFRLSEEQLKIVNDCLKHRVNIISGKAGTGKTTVVRALLNIYSHMFTSTNQNMQFPKEMFCVALSAKASQRIIEATGYEATTIHRFLSIGISDNDNQVYLNNISQDINYLDCVSDEIKNIINQYNNRELDKDLIKKCIDDIDNSGTDIQDISQNTSNMTILEVTKYNTITNCKLLFIDECSMINAQMFNLLLRSVPEDCIIIMCGDDQQLPPIGEGNVFSDILKYEDMPTYCLKTVHRQALKSGILSDANAIRDGIMPISAPKTKIITGELKDMTYSFRYDKDEIQEVAINTYLKQVLNSDGTINIPIMNETVILCPRKQGCINSAHEINNIIQSKIFENTNSQYVKRNGTNFYIGSKVIQRKNDYDRGVYNGEVGYITNIDMNNHIMTVDFILSQSIKTIEFNTDKIDNLELAYALTIHSTQGSGYDNCIVLIDTSHYILLDSCLLYTAITRAKKKCLVVAEPNAFQMAVRKNKNKTRNTFLSFFNKK